MVSLYALMQIQIPFCLMGDSFAISHFFDYVKLKILVIFRSAGFRKKK